MVIYILFVFLFEVIDFKSLLIKNILVVSDSRGEQACQAAPT